MRKRKRKASPTVAPAEEVPQQDTLLGWMAARERSRADRWERDYGIDVRRALKRLERDGRARGAVPASPTEEERDLFGLKGAGHSTLPPF